jgi:hypothetical protein
MSFNEDKDRAEWETNKARAREYAKEQEKKYIGDAVADSARAGIMGGKSVSEELKNVQETLKKREQTHGNFENSALTAQTLKAIFHSAKLLTFPMLEALDLMATKFARILNGNYAEPDHWHDIAGYATLIENELRKKQEFVKDFDTQPMKDKYKEDHGHTGFDGRKDFQK